MLLVFLVSITLLLLNMEDTDLRIAFVYGIRKFLFENPSEIEPRKILNSSIDAIKDVIRHKLNLIKSLR